MHSFNARYQQCIETIWLSPIYPSPTNKPYHLHDCGYDISNYRDINSEYGDLEQFDNLVAEIHREYINAGAQVTMTNTFGANRYKLAEHGLVDKVVEINTTAVELARKAVDASFKEVLIAGLEISSPFLLQFK